MDGRDASVGFARNLTGPLRLPTSGEHLPTDPLDMTGRTVVVTGATMGLGRVIACRFLEHGAEVVICARRKPEQSVAASGRTATFVPADVRNPEEIAAVVSEAVDSTGRIDVLVNNAGGAPPARTTTVSPRFNEKVIALNLLAPLTFSQAVQPVMGAQDNGGVIVNISSVSGQRPNPHGAAYGAAKAGLANLTQTLAHEWGPKIRVLNVVVGLIVTEQADLFYGDQAGIDAVGSTLALGRLGDPGEVADVVLFCASPLASYMSGASVPVHGGGEGPAYLAASTAALARQTQTSQPPTALEQFGEGHRFRLLRWRESRSHHRHQHGPASHDHIPLRTLSGCLADAADHCGADDEPAWNSNRS